ncbi:PREDICTED: histone acetyltransferase HAC12 [Theobroma cacao]|uniref:histone acetyltransferase n=1 Tax=Theobroma cacao TaxID=3641 RepID=A0AB32V876_THECC|nr:PREDICTED: histone acetyltransferase HAC12 [Theobroma cacao]
MNQQTLEYPFKVLNVNPTPSFMPNRMVMPTSGLVQDGNLAIPDALKVLNVNPTPSFMSNSMMMPTSGLVQDGNLAIPGGLFNQNQLNDVTMDYKEIVDDPNQFGFLKEFFGDRHKAQTAGYTTMDWNIAPALGMLPVEGEMVLSSGQASTITSCYGGDGFSDVGSLESRPPFSKGKLLHLYDGKINMMDHIGWLGNNQSSDSMVFPHILGGSLAFSEANTQTSQEILQELSEVPDILPGLNSAMASSTIIPYMQSSRPSEAEAKCSFTGKNQSYCPVEAKTAGHFPQLPLENAPADSRNQLTWAIQHRVLLAYIQYKKSMVIIGNSQVSFVNHMHSATCNKHACKCEQFFSLVSHFDGCHDADCNICSPVWYSCVTNKPHPKFERVKRGLLRDGDSDQPSCGSSETMQPSLKRLKVENPLCPSLTENGICCAKAPLKVQPCYAKLPPLRQLPESPVSNNSEVMEVNMELLPKLIEASMSTKDISYNVADNFPILPTENLPGASEVVVCSYKLEETDAVGSEKEGGMDFRSDTDIADNVIDHSNILESNTLPSFSEGLAAGYEEEETEARTNSNQAELAIENELITQESNCGKELSAGCEEGETEATTNSNQAALAIEDELIAQESNCGKELDAGCEDGETEAKTNSNLAELAMENKLIAPELNCGKEIELESQTIRGLSLIENFTAQQIKEHISSLRQCIDQDIPKKERGKRISNVYSENSCQLCGADKLSLAPAPIYCSSCGNRIRRSANYYITPEEKDIRICLCTSCYKVSRGRSIVFSGIALSKAKLDKIKNEEEAEESWVQCDKCEGWQHQICALFNDKNDMEGKAQFICPICCLKEIQSGERMPPLMSTVFGAKDLPCTMLSDHIEQRLFRRLQKEREEKARVTGKRIDEVPEAEGLVVRVVVSVDKHVKVKKQLLEIVQNENYPAEFPYKSKVILLFQKIDGVDVCLFSMYVQEFGSECGHPNQRCVYIAYLDSVKYFRPETKTAAGEALRTVVYHEILIGYLEYCKKRGFATCYLWACPPLKGEDYILNCHPEIQKTPKTDKLRQWYQFMLQKAAKEKVVVGLTNLYDHFFVSTGKYNSKVTAAHLPYFDGDYWSGAAEDVINNIEKASSEDPKKMGKRIMSKRTLKAMGHTNPSGDATKDILLMQKLGQTILPIKEDFIIAHLQFVCIHCHRAILSGWRWFCSLCKGFQLCERCHDAEQNVYKDCSHTLCNGEKHALCKIMVDDVPSDTDDTDASMDNGLFGNRHSFLSFCQKNSHQFDTLRRAKHSSMMILHYLHNSTLLTAETTCIICYKDTPMDQSWLCEICPNVAVCAACYRRDGCSLHIHKLILHCSAVDSATKNREAKKKELLKMRLLDVLLHACQCRSPCSYPNCLLIKKLFFHAKKCTVRISGGCEHCKKMWLILRLHSRNCKDSDCDVPRCRDLKQHVNSRLQQLEEAAHEEPPIVPDQMGQRI